MFLRRFQDGILFLQPVGRFLPLGDVDQVEPDVPPVVPPPDQPHATLVVMAVEEQVARGTTFLNFAINGREEPNLGRELNDGVDACE